MNNSTLKKISAELESDLIGKRFGRFFQLSPLRLAVDLRLPDQAVLFICAEPGGARIHLAKRRTKDLEKLGGNLSGFGQSLRKRLFGAAVEGVRKLQDERVLIITARNVSDLGEEETFGLVCQLTGRSSNIFLTDSKGAVIDRLRATAGDGQEVADPYSPPARDSGGGTEKPDPFSAVPGETLSETIDRFYLEKESAERLSSRVSAVRKRFGSEIARRKKLRGKLLGDLDAHGDPELWKRYGDLLLSNIADAKRDGPLVTVVDYFDERTPSITIEVDENDSLTAAAEKYFKRYTKARNAKGQIADRLDVLEKEIRGLEEQLARIDALATDGDLSFLEEFEERKTPGPQKKKSDRSFTGARTFVSSDGIEILVGKGSKDNDQLTFRVAKSWDTWLHAADYPGSHVIVRNQTKSEIPQRTLLQAAQLAAFYSDARHQPKVAVNYTQRKFVNKPRGAAPGLVSLSGFKTILVQPMVAEEIKKD